MVALANIAGHTDLTDQPECLVRPILSGLLEWAVSPSAAAQVTRVIIIIVIVITTITIITIIIIITTIIIIVIIIVSFIIIIITIIIMMMHRGFACTKPPSKAVFTTNIFQSGDIFFGYSYCENKTCSEKSMARAFR